GRRPPAAHPGGRGPARAGPRHRRQGARPPRGRARAYGDLPRGPVRDARRGRAARAAVPGGARRRGPALRGLPAGAGGARGAVGGGGRGRQRARAVLPPARGVRHPRPAGGVAAADARRRAGRRVLAVRAAGRVGRGRPDVPGGEGAGRVPHHRHEGLDHPRREGRLLRAVRPHRRRQPRGELLPRPRAGRGADLRQARGEDGPARHPHRHRALGRRRARLRPAHRRRGPGPAHRVLRARLRAPGHRGRRHRARAGRARRRGRLRPRAQRLRQEDHRSPGTGLPARRHGRRRRLRPRHLPRRRPPPRRRAPLLAAGQRRQAGGHRRRHEGDHRRGAGVRRLRLHARLPGRAVHARGQGHADLRGHQPDPAAGHQPAARPV
ncbi:MAG: Acyl-CoA dehydrogenase, short-chain specific, partial [uncultured Pseudonocardia sp.]